MSTKQKPKGVAQQLMDLEEQLGELIDATADPARKKELSDLCDRLAEESRRLIRKNLDASTKEYPEAAAGLEKAAEAAREAIDDVNSVKAAIDAIAKVVDLASRIVV
jgi:gas vesicle protein